MTPAQLEYRILQIADQVRDNRPVEDNHVELKATWPVPDYRTARRLAGHANAAQLEPILWIVGLDEKQARIEGASNAELASWWPELQRHFAGVTPSLLHSINVRIGEKVVAALLFDTSRAPFVITVPKTSPFDREVPWREGNKTRSATREDLLRILVPMVRAPKIEVLEAVLRMDEKSHPELAIWSLKVRFYITPTSGDPLYFPFHHTSAAIQIADHRIPLDWNCEILAVRMANRASNLDQSISELIVRGPGLAELTASGETEKNLVGYDVNLRLLATIRSTEGYKTSLEGPLAPQKPDAQSSAVWVLKEGRGDLDAGNDG